MGAVDVIVKGSNIEAKGVFAVRDFKKGEVVLSWDISHTLPKEVVDVMSDEEKKYISLVDGMYIVMQEPEKYVNHLCEPNTTVKIFCDVAIRDIHAGEEITGDYTEDLPPNTSLKCHCGSAKCRGIIES